jgi:hypothetical protein
MNGARVLVAERLPAQLDPIGSSGISRVTWNHSAYFPPLYYRDDALLPTFLQTTVSNRVTLLLSCIKIQVN